MEQWERLTPKEENEGSKGIRTNSGSVAGLSQ